MQNTKRLLYKSTILIAALTVLTETSHCNPASTSSPAVGIWANSNLSVPLDSTHSAVRTLHNAAGVMTFSLSCQKREKKMFEEAINSKRFSLAFW